MCAAALHVFITAITIVEGVPLFAASKASRRKQQSSLHQEQVCHGKGDKNGSVDMQVPDGKPPLKKLKAPSMSRHDVHLNGKPAVVVEVDDEVSAALPALRHTSLGQPSHVCLLHCHDDHVPEQEASMAPSNASTNSANRGAEPTLTRPSPFGDDYIVGIITIEARFI